MPVAGFGACGAWSARTDRPQRPSLGPCWACSRGHGPLPTSTTGRGAKTAPIPGMLTESGFTCPSTPRISGSSQFLGDGPPLNAELIDVGRLLADRRSSGTGSGRSRCSAPGALRPAPQTRARLRPTRQLTGGMPDPWYAAPVNGLSARGRLLGSSRPPGGTTPLAGLGKAQDGVCWLAPKGRHSADFGGWRPMTEHELNILEDLATVTPTYEAFHASLCRVVTRGQDLDGYPP